MPGMRARLLKEREPLLTPREFVGVWGRSAGACLAARPAPRRL